MIGEKLTREMLEDFGRAVLQDPRQAPPVTISTTMFKALWREAEIRGYRPATGRLGPLERRRMARELWEAIPSALKWPSGTRTGRL